MVAINFTMFTDKVERGEKLQTVRREARCKVGDSLQLFTGMRTKNCRKLADAICTDVDYCAIRPEYITFGDASRHPDARMFALADGFGSYSDMVTWFQKQYECYAFIGKVIKWRLI
jgi:hypothetical protein